MSVMIVANLFDIIAASMETCKSDENEVNEMDSFVQSKTDNNQINISSDVSIDNKAEPVVKAKPTPTSKTLKCPYGCDRFFTKSSNLTQHIRVHTGMISLLDCIMNVLLFSIEGSFTLGKDSHVLFLCFNIIISICCLCMLGEMPYSCSVCKRKFRQSGNLSKHMKCHENVSALKPIEIMLH